jgi:uncharacterized protein YkwD
MDAPRPVRRPATLRAALLLAALSLVACDALPSEPRIDGISLYEAPTISRQALELINQHRRSIGCPTLQWHAESAAVGFHYARQMSDQAFFGHVDPRGGTLRNRLDAAGITGYRRAAETIAAGQTTATKVVGDWVLSPEHRSILQDCRFSYVGIGSYAGQGAYPVYWTAVFLATR